MGTHNRPFLVYVKTNYKVFWGDIFKTDSRYTTISATNPDIGTQYRKYTLLMYNMTKELVDSGTTSEAPKEIYQIFKDEYDVYSTTWKHTAPTLQYSKN